MTRRPDPLYVVYRNGKRFRHFSSRQSAIQYIAACCDLFPGDRWELRCMNVEVSGNE